MSNDPCDADGTPTFFRVRLPVGNSTLRHAAVLGGLYDARRDRFTGGRLWEVLLPPAGSAGARGVGASGAVEVVTAHHDDSTFALDVATMNRRVDFTASGSVHIKIPLLLELSASFSNTRTTTTHTRRTHGHLVWDRLSELVRLTNVGMSRPPAGLHDDGDGDGDGEAGSNIALARASAMAMVAAEVRAGATHVVTGITFGSRVQLSFSEDMHEVKHSSRDEASNFFGQLAGKGAAAVMDAVRSAERTGLANTVSVEYQGDITMPSPPPGTMAQALELAKRVGTLMDGTNGGRGVAQVLDLHPLPHALSSCKLPAPAGGISMPVMDKDVVRGVHDVIRECVAARARLCALAARPGAAACEILHDHVAKRLQAVDAFMGRHAVALRAALCQARAHGGAAAEELRAALDAARVSPGACVAMDKTHGGVTTLLDEVDQYLRPLATVGAPSSSASGRGGGDATAQALKAGHVRVAWNAATLARLLRDYRVTAVVAAHIPQPYHQLQRHLIRLQAYCAASCSDAGGQGKVLGVVLLGPAGGTARLVLHRGRGAVAIDPFAPPPPPTAIQVVNTGARSLVVSWEHGPASTGGANGPGAAGPGVDVGGYEVRVGRIDQDRSGWPAMVPLPRDATVAVVGGLEEASTYRVTVRTKDVAGIGRSNWARGDQNDTSVAPNDAAWPFGVDVSTKKAVKVVVQEGDTVASVVARFADHGVTADDLAEANPVVAARLCLQATTALPVLEAGETVEVHVPADSL